MAEGDRTGTGVRKASYPRSFTGVVAEPTRHLREELAAIGLLAAQVMMAAAHVRDGEGLDAMDREVLKITSRAFRSFAERILFVHNRGQGAGARGMLSAGVTNDVVLPDEHPADPVEIARFYEDLAEKLDSLSAPAATVQDARDIYVRFQTIAERARASAGSSGHELPSSSTPNF
jgi:hypothetical protein